MGRELSARFWRCLLLNGLWLLPVVVWMVGTAFGRAVH